MDDTDIDDNIDHNIDIVFKKVALEDREIITRYLNRYGWRCCECSFANTYLWSRQFPVTWAIIEDTLVFKSERDDHLSFMFPLGEDGQVKKALEVLTGICRKRGRPLSLYLVTPEIFEKLTAWYPGRFSVTYNRDIADYIYDTQSLATLAGKKLHGKRNHVNQFLKTYEGRWVYEPITKDNLEDCFQMGLVWRNENDCEENSDKNAEITVTLNALRLFEELHLTGGLLRVDGQVVAFTIGEPLTADTFVVHIEKAYADVTGAYPMINQQFVQHACLAYRYVNREDDTGAEGLRKAKLSYHPAFLQEKGFARELQSLE